MRTGVDYFHYSKVNIQDIYEDLARIAYWSENHGRKINPCKTSCIFIGTETHRLRSLAIKNINIAINVTETVMYPK